MPNVFHGLLSGLGKVGRGLGRGVGNYLDANAIGGLLGEIDPAEISPQQRNAMRGQWLGSVGAALQQGAPFQAGQQAYQQNMLATLDRFKQQQSEAQQRQQRAAFQQTVSQVLELPDGPEKIAGYGQLSAMASALGMDKEASSFATLQKNLAEQSADQVKTLQAGAPKPVGQAFAATKDGKAVLVQTMSDGQHVVLDELQPEKFQVVGGDLYDVIERKFVDRPKEPAKPFTVAPGASVYDPTENKAVFTAPAAPASPQTRAIQTIDAEGNQITRIVPDIPGSTFAAPPTNEEKNKKAARDRITPFIDRFQDLGKKIITENSAAVQRAKAAGQSIEAALANVPEYRTYVDMRKTIAADLATAQQGSRVSDTDVMLIWLPAIPDVFSDTPDSAAMKWDLIRQSAGLKKQVAPSTKTRLKFNPATGEFE